MNSKQKEFDIVVAHLYKQGRPALNENGDCAYRGKDGTMCAVGCRIPDSRYSGKMDKGEDYDGAGYNVMSLVAKFGNRLRKELRDYNNMFYSLQCAHDSRSVRNVDGTFDLEELARKLTTVAHAHSVIFTRPQ